MAIKMNNIFLKQIYPIGSIYMSMNNTNPKDLFGGKWEQLSNCFLWATENSPGKTGGEKEHTLTVDEMANHYHILNIAANAGAGELSAGYGVVYDTTKRYPINAKNATSGEFTGWGTQSSGENKPHNNMPPYLEVYMWKRIG